jgi:hypothetical protein
VWALGARTVISWCRTFIWITGRHLIFENDVAAAKKSLCSVQDSVLRMIVFQNI